MAHMRSSRSQALMYVGFVFLFSSVFYLLVLRAHTLGGAGGIYVTGIMWCPALAAFTTLWPNGRKASELGWKWPARHYALMSWYVPLVYAAIAYAMVWIGGLGGFPNREFMQLARDQRLLIAGGGDNCVRLLPSLLLTRAEAREAVEKLERACQAARAKAAA